MGKRMADHFRLLVDFLGHEVLVVALVDELRGCRRLDHRPLDLAVMLVADLDALVRQHRPVAVFQITDLVGEGGKRDRVRAEIHFAFIFTLAVADGERRALARADHQVILAGEQKGERKGAAQLFERGRHRLGRLFALFHLAGDQMRHHFGIGLATEFRTVLGKPFAQLAEILDDAIMRDGDTVGGVRMRVALGRLAVRRPAGMADADIAGQRLAREPFFQRGELALGAAAAERAVIERGDAGGVVAAVFQALERLDQMAGDRLASDDSDDPAHPGGWPLCSVLALAGNRKHMEIKTHFAICHSICDRWRASLARLIFWAILVSFCPSS